MSCHGYDVDPDNNDYEGYDHTGYSVEDQSEEYDYDDPQVYTSQDN